MNIITIILFSALLNSAFATQANCKENICSSLTSKINSTDISYQTEPIDSLWRKLVYVKGGCLTGGQYVRDGNFGNEGCVFNRNKEWNIFFQYPKKELTNFLISQMNDTTTTRIHTCPFFSSTNGELAVYCLQKIYSKNWYDFKEFQNYKTRETTGADENTQSWLQQILIDKKQRLILERLWIKEFEK